MSEHSNKPLIIWRLTDGKPGHMQQTLGLAQALSAQIPCEVLSIDVAENAVGWRDFLLGRFTPGLLKKRPHLILAAGHATHFALLAARRAAGGIAVVLMKPSLPAALFDVVIVPEHDGLAASNNTVLTRGVINPMRRGDKKNNSALILVGGPSKHVQWDDNFIAQQIEKIISHATLISDFCIADSRRTPEGLREVLRNTYGENFKSHSTCAAGWLAEKLAHTESVWVSEDSVSMVYEALTAGCSVGLLRLPTINLTSRVMRGVENLISTNTVTPFSVWEKTQELAEPADFNEAQRVATLLHHRFFSGAEK